jgi:D-erythrulose 4-kinase
VAFAGCVLPGWDEPLFEVPDDSFEVGMGIHGEPGVRLVKALSTSELATTMLEPLLAERPADADARTAVLLNGLGSTKYEELFVLWHCLQPALHEAGLELVMPEVGEFVTSLDMAGCSLTMTWLDDELSELWADPADSPAFRRHGPAPVAWAQRHNVTGEVAEETRAIASEASRDAAVVAHAALAAMLAAATSHEEELGRLDAVAGDGDHGSGMARGLRAAVRAADSIGADAGAGSLLRAAGRTFADEAGGTSGLLWGVILEAIGERLGDIRPVEGRDVAEAVRHAVDEVKRIGKADIGDKTMLDAAIPFSDVLDAGVGTGQPLAVAWAQAARAAVNAAASTADLTPRVGRARPLAARSIGHPDAGAVSFGICVTAVGEVLPGNTPP